MSLLNFKHIELKKCFLEHGFKFWIVTGHFVAHRQNRQFPYKNNWLFLFKMGLPYSVATLTTTCVILDLFWPLICCHLLIPSYLVAQWPMHEHITKNCINLNESTRLYSACVEFSHPHSFAVILYFESCVGGTQKNKYSQALMTLFTSALQLNWICS